MAFGGEFSTPLGIGRAWMWQDRFIKVSHRNLNRNDESILGPDEHLLFLFRREN